MKTFFVLLALGLAFSGCGGGEPSYPQAAPTGAPSTAPPASSVVQTVNPQYRTRSIVLETSGKMLFDEERVVRVHAPATGRVVEIFSKPGDVVETGQKLFVVESPDLGQAKSDYVKAVADAERSEKALKLVRELYDARAVPEKDVREADNDFRKAVAERERAASRLRTLGVPAANLADVAKRMDTDTRIVVTASRSGVVVERNVVPGQVVAYGQSDTPVNLFTLADLSTMWVLADVYEPDIPKVKLGQHLSITLPCCPNDRYEGKVGYISDTVDRETRTVKVRAVVANRGRSLKSEMFVRVAIDTGSVRVLTLPQSAVHRQANETFVLVEKDKGAYERRGVRLGAEFDKYVEVLDGVRPEDRVVSTGSILLQKTVK